MWGTCAFISNTIAINFLPDKWGRRKYAHRDFISTSPSLLTWNRMLLAGLSSIILTEIYSAVMQRSFQNTENRVGKGFAILGIYIFVICYCMTPAFFHRIYRATNQGLDSLINSVTWLYGAEILPMGIRSRIMGVAAAAHYIVNVGGMPLYPVFFRSILSFY